MKSSDLVSAQLTVTVGGGKRLIAQAICHIPRVRKALKKGRVVLKGGTTVSAVAEEMIGKPMRISGRITPDGCRSAQRMCDHPHIFLIENGKAEKIYGEVKTVDDSTVKEISKLIKNMCSDDIFITGANIIDCSGNAAIMAGGFSGGIPSAFYSAAMVEGFDTIIAAGLEKYSPGDIHGSIVNAGRKRIFKSMGMAVGLIPLFGQLVTEMQAFSILADVDTIILGRGGVDGAEGSTTFLVKGKIEEVNRIYEIVKKIKEETHSGCNDSKSSCYELTARCGSHLGCDVKKGSE